MSQRCVRRSRLAWSCPRSRRSAACGRRPEGKHEHTGQQGTADAVHGNRGDHAAHRPRCSHFQRTTVRERRAGKQPIKGVAEGNKVGRESTVHIACHGRPKKPNWRNAVQEMACRPMAAHVLMAKITIPGISKGSRTAFDEFFAILQSGFDRLTWPAGFHDFQHHAAPRPC